MENFLKLFCVNCDKETVAKIETDENKEPIQATCSDCRGGYDNIDNLENVIKEFLNY